MRTFEARYGGGCSADCADTFSTEHGHGTYRPTAPCPSCYMIHAGECL